MPLGTEVGLGPGNIMLDGESETQLPVRKKAQLPQFSAHALWPNGWTDQDATWHKGRPRLWPHFV